MHTKQFEQGELGGEMYYLERLYWCFGKALMLVQGAPLQHLIGPNYAVVGADPFVQHHPEPHTSRFFLARITSAPAGMRLEEAVYALQAEKKYFG